MKLDKVAIRDEMLGTDLLSIENFFAPHACKLDASCNVFVH